MKNIPPPPPPQFNDIDVPPPPPPTNGNVRQKSPRKQQQTRKKTNRSKSEGYKLSPIKKQLQNEDKTVSDTKKRDVSEEKSKDEIRLKIEQAKKRRILDKEEKLAKISPTKDKNNQMENKENKKKEIKNRNIDESGMSVSFVEMQVEIGPINDDPRMSRSSARKSISKLFASFTGFRRSSQISKTPESPPRRSSQTKSPEPNVVSSPTKTSKRLSLTSRLFSK